MLDLSTRLVYLKTTNLDIEYDDGSFQNLQVIRQLKMDCVEI